jgi:hypothetical protein
MTCDTGGLGVLVRGCYVADGIAQAAAASGGTAYAEVAEYSANRRA